MATIKEAWAEVVQAVKTLPRASREEQPAAFDRVWDALEHLRSSIEAAELCTSPLIREQWRRVQNAVWTVRDAVSPRDAVTPHASSVGNAAASILSRQHRKSVPQSVDELKGHLDMLAAKMEIIQPELTGLERL